MKILHVMPYSPVPPIFGGALRMYHLLNNLTNYHDVTVLTFASDQERQRIMETFGGRVKALHTVPHQWLLRFRRLGQLHAMVTGQSFYRFLTHRKEMQDAIDRVLSSDDFDVVLTEFPMMASFHFSTRALKVMDAHNVEYDCFRRMWKNARSVLRRAHYYREYQKLFREELDACRKQDALFVTSRRDKELFDLHFPNLPKFIVPNGVDTSYFSPTDETPEPYTMVFTGMMGYVPNYDGMLYFLDEIFPRIQREIPLAKVSIVGGSPPKELLKRRSSSVTVTGFVPDVRPYVHRASVYVVPLRMGGGTRLKVLEAMAMKKPIVTTSVGCEGIDVQDGETVFMEDEPEKFALRVVDLLSSPLLRRNFADRGYELARNRYDWNIIGTTVNDIYDKLVYASSQREEAVPTIDENPMAAHRQETTVLAPMHNDENGQADSTTVS